MVGPRRCTRTATPGGIYRRNDKEADEIEHRTGKRPLTRFGEAMAELEVKVICAHSPQAKGRVERMNKTLQDRLVKMLAVKGITTIQAANAYLEVEFLPELNARFAVSAVDARDAHRPAPPVGQLDAALCPVRERRAVAHDAMVSWKGQRLELLGPDATPRRRREVELRQLLDGTVRLLDVTTQRVLASRLVPQAPPRQPPAKAPLIERVASHAGPCKPATNHPWRSSLAVGGCATARGLASAPPPTANEKGTLQPRSK